MKKIIVFLAGLLLPTIVFAQSRSKIDFTQPGLHLSTRYNYDDGSAIAQMILDLSEFAIAVSAVIAIAALMWAGFTRLTAGESKEAAGESGEIMWAALIGMGIAFGSVVFLQTINPHLIVLKPLSIATITKVDPRSVHIDASTVPTVRGGRGLGQSLVDDPPPLEQIHSKVLCGTASNTKDGFYIPALRYNGDTSTFGGGLDAVGIANGDNLAMGNNPSGYRDADQLFTSGAQNGNMFSHLNPNAYYCAMRFPYLGNANRGTAFWRNQRILITNPANGKSIVCQPVDWGPGGSAREPKDFDLSPGALVGLGGQVNSRGEGSLPGLRALIMDNPDTPLGPCQ